MGKELFKNIPSKVGDLVKDVRNGRIGLPDLQRPFVWRDKGVLINVPVLSFLQFLFIGFKIEVSFLCEACQGEIGLP